MPLYVLEFDPDTDEWVASVNGEVIGVDSSAPVAAQAIADDLAEEPVL